MRLSSISWQKLTWPLDILSEFAGSWGLEGACITLSPSVTLKVLYFYSDFIH